MKATLIFPVCFAVAAADALADVVICSPPPQDKFEVWQEPLPVPDYLDALDACMAHTATTPLPAPRSLWVENQRTAYTNALKKQRVDVIVAPFQIQGYGLERTERAIMSADLAYHLDPAVRVADPFLTSRALGEGARRYDRNDIVELARAVGARTAVVGYVGHDLGHGMTITVQVLELDPNGGVKTVQRDWRGVQFTHVDPPFVVFHRMLPSVLESLALPIAKEPPRRAAVSFPDASSLSFSDLATDKNRLGSSLGLSLLGALASSSDERARERLFERALVASWHFDARGAETDFIRAYTLLNLEHRPAALALINGSVTADAVALRALLNGDLPGASAAVSKIENPLKRLLLGVLVDDLRYQYEKQDVAQATDAESVFGESAPEWLLLAESRSNDANIWRVDAPAAALKALLDDVDPVTGLGVQDLFGGGVVRGISVDDVAIDIAAMRHVARFVERADVAVCCSAANARVAAWDLVSLLEGRVESRMRKYLYLTNVVRSAPQSASDAIDRYRSVFEGHPLFAAARAEYATQMKEQADGAELQRWEVEAREQALVAATWSPGQNRVAHEAVWTLGIRSLDGVRYGDVYGFDYPRRSYWPEELIRNNAGAQFPMRIVNAMRADSLPYARTDITAFSFRPGMPDEDKPRLLAQLESRLVGDPQRVPLMARLRPPRPSSGDAVADAGAAVAEDPENWEIRLSAGRKLIEQHGKWEEAAELLRAHPPFHRESPSNMVRVSNAAYEAGSIFYWGGREDLAVPFYEVAANLQTGAQSQMTSQIRLDILEGRYRAAVAGSYARAQRYPDAYPFRDLLSLMHALGYGEQAWDGFSQVAAAFDNPQVWESALVGQRLEGLTEPEIRAWLKQPGIRDARFRNALLAPRYAVLVNASDHVPPEDLGELVVELEGEPVARVARPGVIELPDAENASGTRQLPRSVYAQSLPPPPTGTRVKSDLAFFGSAYAAIRYGRFDAAVDELQAMANYYPMESKEFSYALPYFAWAAAKTRDADGFGTYLDSLQGGIPVFDLNLARAFFHGVRKDTVRARESLDAALRAHPSTDGRPVLIEYQWAEACESLYRETGDKAFLDLLLAWVVSRQRVEPTHAWPYAMEYTYARTPERKLRALAMTLYLDPTSPRIGAATAKERSEAQAWGAKNNRFLQEAGPPQDTGPTARAEHAPTKRESDTTGYVARAPTVQRAAL